MKVFLVPNYYKQEAVESGLMLELWLSRQGYEVAWAADQRSKIQSTPDIDGSDLVITLGGDGTLLRAALHPQPSARFLSLVFPMVTWAF